VFMRKFSLFAVITFMVLSGQVFSQECPTFDKGKSKRMARSLTIMKKEAGKGWQRVKEGVKTLSKTRTILRERYGYMPLCVQKIQTSGGSEVNRDELKKYFEILQPNSDEAKYFAKYLETPGFDEYEKEYDNLFPNYKHSDDVFDKGYLRVTEREDAKGGDYYHVSKATTFVDRMRTKLGMGPGADTKIEIINEYVDAKPRKMTVEIELPDKSIVTRKIEIKQYSAYYRSCDGYFAERVVLVK
jgi:hypothetical protein